MKTPKPRPRKTAPAKPMAAPAKPPAAASDDPPPPTASFDFGGLPARDLKKNLGCG